MSRLPGAVRRHLAALRAMIVFTIVLGIAYPLVITGIAQAAFSDKADGSPVKVNGRIVGSSLICQQFVDAKGNPLPRYFQSRPSGATDSSNPNDPGCNPGFSAGSQLATTSEKLKATIEQRIQQVAQFNGVDPAAVPEDAVTESASGLDPDISPAYADIQVARVAKARGLDEGTVRALVKKYTDGRSLGFLGEPGVNVLKLDIALDALKS